jgi:hypothetical protein
MYNKNSQEDRRRQQDTQTTKQDTFTYTGNDTSGVMKVFRDKGLKIDFKTNITHNQQSEPPDTGFNIEGIYRLKCVDCDKVYIGRTAIQYVSDTRSTLNI